MKVYDPRLPISAFDDWFREGSSVLTPTDNLAEVLVEPYKIAFLSVFTEPTDLSQFDLVVLSDIEFFRQQDIDLWAQQANIKQYLLALGGYTTLPPQPNVLYRPWWMFNLISKNTFEDTVGPKTFLCDALLGCKKTHRDYVMAHFQSSGLLDQSIVTYRTVFGDKTSDNDVLVNGIHDHRAVLSNAGLAAILDGKELAHPYLSPNLKTEWEVNKTTPGYSEAGVLSQEMPWQIYRNTHYTVVAETGYFDQHFFMSEKVSKPMFAKRLFIVFGTQGYLKNLQSLGFKTFGSIIDESYDLVEDAELRIKLAFNQLEYLATQDPEIIKQKIADIVEHNHQHLYNLRQQTINKMKQMVYSYLPPELVS